MHFGAVFDDEAPCTCDSCSSLHELARAPGVVEHVEHEADEAIAFAPNAVQHLASLHPNVLGMNPKAPSLACVVRRIGRGDQKLTRHAADTRTGGPQRA